MQIIYDLKPTMAHPRPNIEIMTKAMPRKLDPLWKPEPCDLTRDELRKVVADVLG